MSEQKQTTHQESVQGCLLERDFNWVVIDEAYASRFALAVGVILGAYQRSREAACTACRIGLPPDFAVNQRKR